MSMVNDAHRFVFLHVAKTGGRSINMHLKNQVGRDGVFNTKKINPSVNQLGRMLGLEAKAIAGAEKWQAYFTFAFVRNPWDRAVSIFEHLRTDFAQANAGEGGKLTEKANLLLEICKALNVSPQQLSFDQFVFGILRDRAFENYHWDIQANALTDGEGDVLFDFVGRFERLQSDFNYACDHIGIDHQTLPHFNKSDRKPWTSYYSKDSFDAVAQIYAEDIDLFGYRDRYSDI